VDADVATMTLLERLNDGGEVFLTHTLVRGQAVLRIAIGAPATTRAHVERVWTLLREGHDWLAADFAAAAAEREAAREAEREAEREAARAVEAQPVAQADAERAAEQAVRDGIEAEPIDVDPVMTGTGPVTVEPADLAGE
jgi:aromatic-L-amino-acid decarboxylase